MNSIIEVNNISKKYNIVHQKGDGYIALRDVLANFAKHPFKSAKNIMKQKLGIGIEEFWALKDINFSVEKGEVLGIIGPNGAGKSTLLKILSQITPPTTGEIKMNGKVGSLLEVGTGFNPELTGRENVYLNGAILGMTKKEISDKFNDIVEFSGVEKFIDTPVKRYSSGMKVRLGFSVAAHLEPDILLVDEVLAVGDAEFQKKCLGKMDEVTKKAGRTILFVSHNMAAVQNLCKRCILLENGEIKMTGKAENVISTYLNSQAGNEKMLQPKISFENYSKKPAQLLNVAIKNCEGKYSTILDMAKHFFLEIDFIIKENRQFYLWFAIHDNREQKMIVHSVFNDGKKDLSFLPPGEYKSIVKIDSFLNENDYYFTISINEFNGWRIHSAERVLSFKVVNISGRPYNSIVQAQTPAVLLKKFDWDTQKIREGDEIINSFNKSVEKYNKTILTLKKQKKKQIGN